MEIPLLENRAGCLRFSGGDAGDASVGNDVLDLVEFGEVAFVGVVGTAEGSRGIALGFRDVFMYKGAAAGFLCNNEGFFIGLEGILLATDEIRPVAALLSARGGESSKVDDLCRFRSRADIAASFAPAPPTVVEYRKAELVLLFNSLRSLEGEWWSA